MNPAAIATKKQKQATVMADLQLWLIVIATWLQTLFGQTLLMCPAWNQQTQISASHRNMLLLLQKKRETVISKYTALVVTKKNVAWKKNAAVQNFGSVRFFLISLFSPRLVKGLIIWSKYNTNSSNVKYYYNLKQLLSFIIQFNLFLWVQRLIFSINTPVISVAWSFIKHYDMLIFCSRNISYYH